jgi:hypothetical protein
VPHGNYGRSEGATDRYARLSLHSLRSAKKVVLVFRVLGRREGTTPHTRIHYRLTCFEILAMAPGDNFR